MKLSFCGVSFEVPDKCTDLRVDESSLTVSLRDFTGEIRVVADSAGAERSRKRPRSDSDPNANLWSGHARTKRTNAPEPAPAPTPAPENQQVGTTPKKRAKTPKKERLLSGQKTLVLTTAEQRSEAAQPRAAAPVLSLPAPYVWERIETVEEHPEARWGHTLSCAGAEQDQNKKLILFGGDGMDDILNGLALYHPELRKWSRVRGSEGVAARSWHAACVGSYGNMLLIMGGETEESGLRQCCNDMMVFDSDLEVWYPPYVTGSLPSKRSGHASCYLPHLKSLVVFGGCCGGSKWSNEVYILETELWEWKKKETNGELPPPRSYHSCTCVDKDIVVYGGNDGDVTFDDIWILNTVTWTWRKADPKGYVPPSRTGHSAVDFTLSGRKGVLVFGGWDYNTAKTQTRFNDLLFFDVDRSAWHMVDTGSQGPSPRTGTAMARVGSDVYLFGGSIGTERLSCELWCLKKTF